MSHEMNEKMLGILHLIQYPESVQQTMVEGDRWVSQPQLALKHNRSRSERDNAMHNKASNSLAIGPLIW